jgi:Na+-driven multidrug efflux pump
VLQTIVGLMVFLAYATTPAVARRFGAGDPTRAVSVGIDGMWLALGIGAILALAGYLTTPFLVGLFALRRRLRGMPRPTSASRCGVCPPC